MMKPGGFIIGDVYHILDLNKYIFLEKGIMTNKSEEI